MSYYSQPFTVQPALTVTEEEFSALSPFFDVGLNWEEPQEVELSKRLEPLPCGSRDLYLFSGGELDPEDECDLERPESVPSWMVPRDGPYTALTLVELLQRIRKEHSMSYIQIEGAFTASKMYAGSQAGFEILITATGVKRLCTGELLQAFLKKKEQE